MEELKKTAVGLHLTAGTEDNILTYSDCILDEGLGKTQSEVNSELLERLKNEFEWGEY